MTDPVALFNAQRSRLFAIAYRMLAIRADAEDVVQEAWLRWAQTDHAAVQSAAAWLVTIVTRLSIDRLRAAQAEREAYIGWWLPEPLVELDERTPESEAEMASDLSVAFMWLLERLGPEERAAFLLRQVFDHDYAEVAEMLGKSEASCRQLVHRAAEKVQQEKTRNKVAREAHQSLLSKFVAAARTGDKDALRALLAENIELVGDGGGKVPSFMEILRDRDRIAELYWGMLDKFPGQVEYRMATINGEPGLLRFIGGKLESAQAFVTGNGQICAIYAVRNPDKLAAVPMA
ncbi:RNA polymerase sigma-70 factor [Pseudoduganella ginsengisoli]|uniref:RNA polymerase sigma-70 factor n=1 Tax=Pseudoduganella ginsengisoli TaxID=1462440 RepID=A0A6L6Q5A3_9BURK|nr:RNA polymerase sigma-70 factor [Pseudoduganella ginsengisoli]MTW04441.1 RNA polymerase sigma-70 factor [Pseudoduganella ginsengisoli]